MTQELLNLGPMPPILRPSPGTTVVANRPGLGRCVLKVRRHHATAITADRIEVIDRARARGETVPRTKPTTLPYGHFIIIPGDPRTMDIAEDTAALRVACPYCKAAAGQRCSTTFAPTDPASRLRSPHPERYAAVKKHGNDGAAELSDPAPIGAQELRRTLSAIRESLEKCPATGPARANIARRILVVEERLELEIQL